MIAIPKSTRLIFLLLLMAGFVCLFSAKAVAASSAAVKSNPATGNPYEVQVGKASLLTYSLVYSVGPNSEGVTPSVNSITAKFTVNNGGTIVQSGGPSWTETLEPGQSPMAISCSATGPKDGFYGVQCAVTVSLSDGESLNAGTATDSFEVADITVNISGPPYVIYDNSQPYDNTPVESKYTASVGGEPAGVPLTYQWTTSADINDLNAGAVNPPDSIETDGNDPNSDEGNSGLIECAVYQGVYPFIGNSQVGQKSVIVHDEYVITEKSTTPAQWPASQSPFLFTLGALTNNGTVPTAITRTLSGSSNYTATIIAGFNSGLSVGVEDLASADFGLSLSASGTVSGTSSYSTTVTATVPAGATWNVLAYCIVNEWSGTWQTWGTSGETGSGNWTYSTPESAASINSGGFGIQVKS